MPGLFSEVPAHRESVKARWSDLGSGNSLSLIMPGVETVKELLLG